MKEGNMVSIRRGDMDDFYFVAEIDLVSEGISQENSYLPVSFEEESEYFDKIARFLEPSLNTSETEFTACPKYTLICEDGENKERIGLIMFLIRNMNDPAFQHFGIYDKFERSVFPADGRVCEIFQLWVAPGQRRRGLATELMKKAEEIALHNNIKMIYTHTEAVNDHVVELCEKLGYEVIRKGTLWDEIVRISQVKYL
ncbi:MAG: GNAT family N-acetyltransferase [Dehalococcoidales bacterium]